METKHIDLQIKEAGGSVPGIIAYASTFDRIPDAYGDVIAKGAFTGTLKRLEEDGYNLPLLYAHDMGNPANIIGTVTKAEEDDHGLKVEAIFDMENPNAEIVRRAVLAKAINKLSFAFTVLDEANVKLEDGTKVRELRELEIYEVSLVVVPANSNARVIDAKDACSEVLDPVEHTEPETDAEVKAEEPDGAKAEEPEVDVKEEETIESVNPIPEKETNMDEKTMEIIGAAQPAEKGLREVVTETFVGKNLKANGRFSACTPEIKAATWMGAPTLYEYTHRVPQDKKLLGIADLFNTYVLSEGNVYTYVPLADKDGAFAAVNEGAQKPLVDFAKTPVNVALVNYAGILKVTDQCIEDAEWLVSAIEGRGIRNLERVIDGAALAAVTGASGINAVSATSDPLADILSARGAILANSGFMADAIIINPTDFAGLLAAERQQPQSFFGPNYDTILGMKVIESDLITSGTCLVGAFKDAATMAIKGGIRVDMTNSNDTDFVFNLVAIRVERRAGFAIEVPKGFALIS